MKGDNRAVRMPYSPLSETGYVSPSRYWSYDLAEEVENTKSFGNIFFNIHRPEMSSTDPFGWIEIDDRRVAVIEGLNRPKALYLTNALKSARALTEFSILEGESFAFGQLYMYMILENLRYAIITDLSKWVF